MAGLAVGGAAGVGFAWGVAMVGGGSVGLGVGCWLMRGGKGGLAWMGVAGAAAMAAGVGWWGARGEPVGARSLARWVVEPSVLVGATGRIVGKPRVRAEPDEGLSGYLFDPPKTWFILSVEEVRSGGRGWPVRGRLLVRQHGADLRPEAGDRVRCWGWLSSIPGPSNPGERDFAATMRREGVVGRLTLKSRGNLEWVDGMAEAGRPSRRTLGVDWLGWREAIRERASRALRAGMAPIGEAGGGGAARGGEAGALLDALVLGRRNRSIEDLYRDFRLSGLAHVLSISGLHVGLLAVGAWFVVLVVSGRPGLAAVASLIAVGLYVAVVPWRVPIVRAGFMTAMFCLGLGGRWRMRALTLLSIIALLWLLARPGDLWTAGFQLSFGIVAALITLATPLANRLLSIGAGDAGLAGRRPRWWVERLVQYAAAGMVSWAVATPLVAYHFGLVSFIALPLSLVALPLVAAMLWLGLAKAAAGMVWIPLGGWLGPAMSWMGGALGALASGGSTLPGAWARVPGVSAWWAALTLAAVVAALSGRVRRRSTAALVGVALAGCVAWPIGLRVHAAAARPALTVRALAVGEGSCFLLESDGERWLFDAGSRSSRDIGRYAVVPALRALGVDRLDTIVVSHPDYDHYSGVLAVVESIPVGRVVTNRRLLAEAAEQIAFDWTRGLAPSAATGHLLDGLDRHNIPVVGAEAGWTDRLGRAHVRALWPPAGRRFESSNDNSLVLRFDAAGRRVMMCGDIQARAMLAMTRSDVDIAADVCDLPHHGSYPRLPGRAASPADPWVARVNPSIWLQSGGRARLRRDPWPPVLGRTPRLITARDGMATVEIHNGGRITWHAYRRD